MSTLEPLERPPAPWARSRWPTGAAIHSYAALGDSFTAGTGCGPGECWADRLATRLAAGCPGFAYRNFAVEGATSEQVLGQLGPAVHFSPDLATVVCGGNDVLFSVRPDADAYAARLARIFQSLKEALPKLRLLTATGPEHFGFLELGPRTRARLERGIAAFNQATRRVAADFEVPCVEVARHPGLAEPASFQADGLHPSAYGHDQAATEFSRLLGVNLRGDV